MLLFSFFLKLFSRIVLLENFDPAFSLLKFGSIMCMSWTKCRIYTFVFIL